MLHAAHRLVDWFAMWTEDQLARKPEPFRSASPSGLECFGPLPPLPAGPVLPGPWSAPSPLQTGAGPDRMALTWIPAVGPSLGTVLLVPPWKISRPGLVSGWVELLAGAGRDVWLLTPPHHLERTLPGERSGEGFVSLDLSRLRLAFEQTILEIRVCLALAAQRGGEVGLLGLSLGALAGALAITSDEPVDFAGLIAPPADLALILSETRIGRRYRRLAARAGSPLPELPALRSALAPFSPGERRPRAGRLLIGAGLHDLIAPASAAVSLAAAWDVKPRLYARGHITLLFACRAVRQDVLALVSGDAAGSPADPLPEMKLPLMYQRGQRTHSSPQGAAELDGEGRSTELSLDNGPQPG